MATTNSQPVVNQALADQGQVSSAASLVVLLAPMAPEPLEKLLANLGTTFADEKLVIATPDSLMAESHPDLHITTVAAGGSSWTLTATDFSNAYQLAQEHDAQAILMLGAESASLRPEGLRALGAAILDSPVDLCLPRYDLPPRAGLVNSAILYPLTRALFASRARFPLAIDLGLSRRMAERLGGVAQRFTAMNQGESLLWPVNEASVAGFVVNEVPVGPRVFPQPTDSDINAILALVTGSLFSDIEAKASFWQRPRTLPAQHGGNEVPAPADAAADITPMLDAFRLAYTNLREIWSLVLPPNSLLGIKRLSQTESAAFRMPDNLWARVVYDFLIAYRLRTINRGHLLGALIPLYLGWVASHINTMASGVSAEQHIEAVAAAFEADKPYLVSRWRWPDRFNP